MGFEQNRLIMPSFIKSQFSYYPLMSMFCSKTSMNKLNHIPKKCLPIVKNDYNSNFSKLLESSHELLIHETCIIYLMIEVYKYLHGLFPELMTEIFTLQKKLTKFAIFIYLALKTHRKRVLDQMQQGLVLVSCGKKYLQQ